MGECERLENFRFAAAKLFFLQDYQKFHFCNCKLKILKAVCNICLIEYHFLLTQWEASKEAMAC